MPGYPRRVCICPHLLDSVTSATQPTQTQQSPTVSRTLPGTSSAPITGRSHHKSTAVIVGTVLVALVAVMLAAGLWRIWRQLRTRIVKALGVYSRRSRRTSSSSSGTSAWVWTGQAGRMEREVELNGRGSGDGRRTTVLGSGFRYQRRRKIKRG
jgi:hypothetical protein